jgi:hypothetical protein
VAKVARSASKYPGYAEDRPNAFVKNHFRVLALLIPFALAAVCLLQFKQNGDLKRKLTALQGTIDEKDKRAEIEQATLKKLERQQSGYRSQVQSLLLELQALRSAPIAESKPGLANSLAAGGGDAIDSKEGQKNGFGDMLAKMMADPAMKKLMRQQQAATVDMMYAPLFKEMGLSAEDKERFKELLLDRQMKAVESGGMFMKLQGEDTDRSAVMNELAAQQKEFDAQLKTFLGDERYVQYTDFNETMAERMAVNQLSQQLASSSNPLNDDQSRQLLAIMKEEKKSVTPVFGGAGADGSANMANWQALMSEDRLNEFFKQREEIDQRVLERAKTVLTREQLTALDTHQSNQLQMQRMGMSMAAKMFGAQKSDDNAPAK